MRYDPEDLLHRSGLGALGAASFLHENYTSFVAEEAIDDVATCAAYLSDAGGWACKPGSWVWLRSLWTT